MLTMLAPAADASDLAMWQFVVSEMFAAAPQTREYILSHDAQSARRLPVSLHHVWEGSFVGGLQSRCHVDQDNGTDRHRGGSPETVDGKHTNVVGRKTTLEERG